jgi:hypothetical protein
VDARDVWPGRWVYVVPDGTCGVVRRVGPHRYRRDVIVAHVEPAGIAGQVVVRIDQLWPAEHATLDVATRAPRLAKPLEGVPLFDPSA